LQLYIVHITYIINKVLIFKISCPTQLKLFGNAGLEKTPFVK